jgi:hypothetical protein
MTETASVDHAGTIPGEYVAVAVAAGMSVNLSGAWIDWSQSALILGWACMSYARFRLGLGMTAVGTLVVWRSLALLGGWPTRWLSSATDFQLTDLVQLTAVVVLAALWLLPFDWLGGYWGPRRFRRTSDSPLQWARDYGAAVLRQIVFYVVAATAILAAGRLGGWLAVGLAVTLLMWVGARWRSFRLSQRFVADDPPSGRRSAIEAAKGIAGQWGIDVPRVEVVDHRDVGFTGGIVRVGGRPVIVLPRLWVQQLKPAALACVLARRALAIHSGAYARGVGMAYAWNGAGLLLSGWLPNAGFTSVAELATTLCYFTIWSFLGLLWLPTLSRSSAFALDSQLTGRGGDPQSVRATALQLDRWQDEEPQRAVWIERIFHPIPSAVQRGGQLPQRPAVAWNAARLTLAYSWGCVGLLSRAVHCNLGRPELWELLPVD